MLTGGYLKDIPKPHRRKFPGELRRVGVSIAVYDLAGGHHYWVTLREENNPVWNPLTNGERNSLFAGTPHGDRVVGWQIAWDDDEGKGRTVMSSALDFRWQVADFVEQAQREHFPLETYVLTKPYNDDPFDVNGWRTEKMEGRYYYQREGD